MNARQAAKKWKQKYTRLEKQLMKPIVIQEPHDVRDVGYDMAIKRTDWECFLSRDPYLWERHLDRVKEELGEYALKNSSWRASWNKDHTVMHMNFRTKILDISRGGFDDLEAVKEDLTHSESW